eukprot:TRINITY_DN8488_c0_g1_i2.p2 TRINITY_DN8488_c0_g1~~TRINITY_DN8488_c0_g1_i2.p2  ORF type:complete len:165 (+),score=24.57 TRINITY_DN8488_c0_g1_i2:39-533(+)
MYQASTLLILLMLLCVVFFPTGETSGIANKFSIRLGGEEEAYCNDGSPAQYYYHPPSRVQDEDKWLFYLEGGGFCFDDMSCQQRAVTNINLTSSAYWPDAMSLNGILSTNQSDNALFWSWNIVYIPYCSSDMWTGASSHGGIQFRGHNARILCSTLTCYSCTMT